MVMGTHYRQCSSAERDRLAVLRASGHSVRRIARALGRHHSTVVRELRRNATPGALYLAGSAGGLARERKQRAGQRARLKQPELRAYVEAQLTLGWSPEQIAGRLPLEHPGWALSHEAIYQYVYTAARWCGRYLPRRRSWRWPRGRVRMPRCPHIPNRVPMTQRPAAIAARTVVGHWEADTMAGCDGSTAVLAVLVERRSRYVHLTKLDRKTAAATSHAVCRRLSGYPPGLRQSLTYDNGSENAEHEAVNQVLGTTSYFCHPYRSWEKGTVENTIGLVRRLLPKGRNLDPIQHRFVRHIAWLLNTRPRKC